MSTPTDERFDIVVSGLDPERDRAEVLRAVATRLVKSTAEIEMLLESAPSTLMRALDDADAQKIVSELRALGARVKPQPAAPEIAADAPPAKIELLYWSTDDEGYERPAPPKPTLETPEPKPPIVVLDEPPAAPAPPSIVVKEEGAWHAPDSKSASVPSKPPAATPSTPPPPSPARFGRASAPVLDLVAPPFFRALPRALVTPLRHPLRLVLATLLAWIAMLAMIFCLRTGTNVGPLLGAIAMFTGVSAIGVTLQCSASSLAAARLAERELQPMPGRLMEDYLRPGVGIVIALALLATALSFAMPELARLHVPRILRVAVLALSTIYAVTGFVLASASGSSLAYLDVVGLGHLALRSPIRGLVITVPTSATLFGCGFVTMRILGRSLDTPMPELLVPTGICALLALLATYVLAFSGGAMGTLLRATSAVPSAK